MSVVHLAAGLSVFLLVALQREATAATYEVGPKDRWCATINSAAPGDEIILAPGWYTTPCWITVRARRGSPIVVRSNRRRASERAVFAYPGATSNVIDLSGASHFILRGLFFAETRDGVDAIKIRGSRDILIEGNLFQGIGGISVSANDGDSARVTILNNVFRQLKATALYFGCHDGFGCHATHLLIEGNLIDGVMPLDARSVGYGVQIKLNSHGIVRRNTIYRTRGPGIMLYGSNRGDPSSVVEGNYVEGSFTDAGIVIGGGPAIVSNNIAVGNAAGGISAQNYAGRNLQRDVSIVHNTVVGNGKAGIVVAGWSEERGNVLAFNAIAPHPGTPPILPPTSSGMVVGNIICTLVTSCFAAAESPAYDLGPAPRGLTAGDSESGAESRQFLDEFLGVQRGRGTDVGR